MARIHYRIVAHDGGWAYKLNDVFSEPFSSKAAALAAAKRVAAEQHVPGDTTHIEYQDELGRWHSEMSEGDDRPEADAVARTQAERAGIPVASLCACAHHDAY